MTTSNKDLIEYFFKISIYNQTVSIEEQKNVPDEVRTMFLSSPSKQQKYILKQVDKKIKKYNYKKGTSYGN